MTTVHYDAVAVPDAMQSPRSASRPSLTERRINENHPGITKPSPKVCKPSPNRFGFVERSLSPYRQRLRELMQSANAAEDVASTDDAPPPVKLLKKVGGDLGDLDAYTHLLKWKCGWDQYHRKEQIDEHKEAVRSLKAALKDLVDRARSVSVTLAPAQEDLSRQMHDLFDEARTQRNAAAKANEDLRVIRKHAMERAQKVEELTKSSAAATVELIEQRANSAGEGKRADVAEAQLRERTAEVEAARKEIEELRATLATQEAAASEAAAVAKTEAERLSAEGAATQATLDTVRAEAQRREAELTGSLDAETAKVVDLTAKLQTATSELAQSKEAHEALTKEHATLTESSAATCARLESVEGQLLEKTTTLNQKDDDLRESRRVMERMQQDNGDVIAHERQRSQSLEEEAKALRSKEQEAVAATEGAKAEMERVRAALQAEMDRVRAELEMSKAELGTTQGTLQQSTTAREKLAIDIAEKSDALAAKQTECSQLQARLGDSQEQLAAVGATLEAKTKEAESIERAKHELDVEFRCYQEHHSSSNQQQMTAISELKLTVDRLSQQVESKSTEVHTHQGSLMQQQVYLETLEAKLREQEATRRALHNTIQELKGNIRVFCRVRPSGDAPSAIKLGDANKLSLAHSKETHNFGFDKTFGPAEGQTAVFAEVEGLVQSSLDGYKVCIFAYGQTGSGKTHTMQGGEDPASWGLIPRALAKILDDSKAMMADGWTWTLQATFLEIYNDTLRDLLHDHKKGELPNYAIRPDDAWGMVVANMARVEINSMEQINKLMAKASKARAVGCTDMNSQSSRSHSIFALYLKGVNTKLGVEHLGSLNLVDLAGSERLDKSGAVGAALKETQAINKSLSALAHVFVAKAKGNSHVSYRDSKLTHLMMPCLSGNGKTLMVVNVRPDQENAHETLCALRFAKDVNQCDTGGGSKPKKHERPVSADAAVPEAKQSKSESSSKAPPRAGK